MNNTNTSSISSHGFTKITDAAVLARELTENPNSWIPVLGNGISFDIFGNPNSISKRHRQIQRLAGKATLESDTRSQNITELFLAAQDNDFDRLEQILFGDCWDESTFLDASQHKQIRFRKEFAEGLMKTEEINIELTKRQVPSPDGSFRYNRVDLTPILTLFPHLLLTTCQDETIEAFMEYQKSLPISQNVCTPDAFLTSPKWERRLDALLTPGHLFRTGNAGTCPVLLKLRGSCRKPCQMLFSERDFKAYYSDTALNPLAAFLKKLFRQKNLLIIGMETRDRYGNPDFPESLTALWKASGGQARRYYLPAADADEISRFLQALFQEFQRLQAFSPFPGTNHDTIIPMGSAKAADSSPSNSSIPSNDLTTVVYENHPDALPFDPNPEHTFWSSYIRRPRTGIPQKEKEYLYRKILKTADPASVPNYWNQENLKLLAMAANNLADFYDLEKMLGKFLPREQALTPDTVTLALKNMIESRLSKESKLLYCLLSRYGGGFPSGFLELLAENEGDLRIQKKAAIQLSNSGICIKGQQRKNIHSRMHYADNLMLTAKTGLEQQKLTLKNTLQNINRQISDSYFYVSEDFPDPQPNVVSIGKTEYMFSLIFQKLTAILKCKSEGYTHFRSLLETEMPAILHIILSLSSKNYPWIPQLIYYLFQESRMVPHIGSGNPGEISLKEQLKRLLSQTDQQPNYQQTDPRLHKIMIYLALSILESQSRDDRTQEAALDYCEKAKALLFELSEDSRNPEEFFNLKLQIYFSIIRIYGRRSSIKEVERCAKKSPEAPQQKQMLKNMNEYLNAVKTLIRKHKTPFQDYEEEAEAQLAQLTGDYHFKMSQYRWENRKYRPAADTNRPVSRTVEDESYKNALKAYRKALGYYNKYPHRFELQKADVLRSMADVHCQDSKSRECPENNKESKMLLDDCCRLLFQAYEIYRKHTNLHGIADVLQSMGNTETYQTFHPDAEEYKRSTLCFYKTSSELYRSLGDDWSQYIVDAFWKQAKAQREKAYKC